jgi:hypothetical protein
VLAGTWRGGGLSLKTSKYILVRPLGQPVEGLVVQSRHRVGKHDGWITWSTEVLCETRGQSLEGVGHDQGRRDAFGLELEGVVQTARCTGASITEAGQDEARSGCKHAGDVRVDRCCGGAFGVDLEL